VIDDEVGRRRRAMERQLRAVEVLPEAEAAALLEYDGVRRTKRAPPPVNGSRAAPVERHSKKIRISDEGRDPLFTAPSPDKWIPLSPGMRIFSW